MTNKEIQQECELMFKQIKDAENRIKELRAICKHEHTHRGLYSWRVGSYEEGEICDYCGKLISDYY